MNHHLCIYEHHSVFDGELIPYGSSLIEEKLTAVIDSMLDEIIVKIGEGNVTVCGTDPARRMVGRKLEDRLGREVKYEN